MILVIFDIDGTLVDSQHHIVKAQGMAFAAHGLVPPSRETALSVVGLSLHEAFVELAGVDGPTDSLAEAYKAAWAELRREPGYAEVLYPGADVLVRDLAAHPSATLAIATGKSRKGVERLLASRGWDGLFASIQTADEHPSKPDPSMVIACLAETGMTACDATMIGDTTYDMEMATAAGVAPIGVAWGYHPPAALRDAGAAAIVTTIADLRTKLETAIGEAAAA